MLQRMAFIYRNQILIAAATAAMEILKNIPKYLVKR
jgi:hypothetical protein